MKTRGQSYARTPAWTSCTPTPEPASTRKCSSPSVTSVAGPRRFGFGGGDPVPSKRTFSTRGILSRRAPDALRHRRPRREPRGAGAPCADGGGRGHRVRADPETARRVQEERLRPGVFVRVEGNPLALRSPGLRA